MSFLDWNEATILNHPTLDREHKQMVDDTNQLFLHVEANEKEKANNLLLKIVDDLKIHFETEDRLMKESKIPLYISHKLEHDRFYGKISTLQKSIASGKDELRIEHLKLVKIWFNNHMDFKDRPLADFLIENKII